MISRKSLEESGGIYWEVSKIKRYDSIGWLVFVGVLISCSHILRRASYPRLIFETTPYFLRRRFKLSTETPSRHIFGGWKYILVPWG